LAHVATEVPPVGHLRRFPPNIVASPEKDVREGPGIALGSRKVARAFAPRVRVNAVAPGPVLTRWLANHQDRVARYVQQTPMRQAATPEQVAEVVGFLALDASLVTGQVLIVDGGRTM
jgi:NAD(P)-dependent dehydrogenase (short-subunit alcohol dehydrogenase family)